MRRYAGLDGFSIQEVADKVKADYGKIDILVHSLANGPEVQKPLLETSRAGERCRHRGGVGEKMPWARIYMFRQRTCSKLAEGLVGAQLS